MEVILHKLSNGLMSPANDEEAFKLKKLKIGAGVRCNVSQMRNYKFHKRWFVLANLAFDIWKETNPPIEHRGDVIQPNFEVFREDLTILTGYYTKEFNIKGELRLKAKSISFASMTQDEFEGLYSATINTILGRVLDRPDLDEEKMRAWVEQVMTFDK
jgi:hypothetical protein